MRKIIIALVSMICLNYPVYADTLQLKDNAPERYLVKKGDTLWGISGKFLKDPWRWPEIWRMNQTEVQNPHWIYPGDVLALDFSDGSPRLRKIDGLESENSGAVSSKLSPKIRVTPLDKVAIPAISPSAIGPFLSKPIVVEKDALLNSPRIAAGPDERVFYTVGDRIYAVGLDTKGATSGSRWQIYRPGKALLDPDKDPDSKEGQILGYETIYLGEALIQNIGPVSTLKLISVAQEISIGDRLISGAQNDDNAFIPRAPASEFKGKIISSFNGVQDSGQYYIVVVNKGSKNGLDRGNVLGVYKQGRLIKKESDKETALYTPKEKYADLMLFRVFPTVSYGIIMQSTEAVRLNDEVAKP